MSARVCGCERVCMHAYLAVCLSFCFRARAHIVLASFSMRPVVRGKEGGGMIAPAASSAVFEERVEERERGQSKVVIYGPG